MRRNAPTLMPLLLGASLLSGCAYVGSPVDGLGGFGRDVFSLRSNPNQPVIDSPNARRVMGMADEVEPLETEPGNVWPGPLPPAKTISDLQREQSGAPPIDAMPTPRPPGTRGSSVSPAALPATALAPPAANPVPNQPATGATPRGRVLQTSAGPATTVIGSNGVETYTLPNGRSGIVMPNANGSLTLIGPDGTTQTIPAPR